MSWFWSPSKVAFYPAEQKPRYVACGTWPDDVVPVSDEEFTAALPDKPDGKHLAADADGKPIRVPL